MALREMISPKGRFLVGQFDPASLPPILPQGNSNYSRKTLSRSRERCQGEPPSLDGADCGHQSTCRTPMTGTFCESYAPRVSQTPQKGLRTCETTCRISRIRLAWPIANSSRSRRPASTVVSVLGLPDRGPPIDRLYVSQ